MSSPLASHWPNRPEEPFWWFAEWGGGDPFFSLEDEPTRLCCITSIQLSSQADITYFDMRFRQDGLTETIASMLVPATTTVAIAYPTPLVVGGGESPWQFSFGPVAIRGLFQATFVGFDASPGPKESAPGTHPRRKPAPRPSES
jgi:hypothetical protein